MISRKEPRDLLIDQAAELGHRIADKLLRSNATPDEYQQLSPYVERFFTAVRKPASERRQERC